MAFGEALEPEFADYARRVVANARTLASALRQRGFSIVSGGTDTHIVLVDLRSKGLTGKRAESILDAAGITCNKNGIPFDPEKPFVTSGIRLGSSALTTRGFDAAEFETVAELITTVIDAAAGGEAVSAEITAGVAGAVAALCARRPIYDTANG